MRNLLVQVQDNLGILFHKLQTVFLDFIIEYSFKNAVCEKASKTNAAIHARVLNTLNKSVQAWRAFAPPVNGQLVDFDFDVTETLLATKKVWCNVKASIRGLRVDDVIVSPRLDHLEARGMPFPWDLYFKLALIAKAQSESSSRCLDIAFDGMLSKNGQRFAVFTYKNVFKDPSHKTQYSVEAQVTHLLSQGDPVPQDPIKEFLPCKLFFNWLIYIHGI